MSSSQAKAARDAIRALLATLLASPGVLPNPAHAQPRVLRVVSVLGYIEGRNLSFDAGAGEFSRERTRQLAAEAIAFSKARGLAICRSSNRRRSNWSSIS